MELAQDRSDFSIKILKQSTNMANTAIQNANKDFINQMNVIKSNTKEYEANYDKIKTMNNYNDLFKYRNELMKKAVLNVNKLEEESITLVNEIDSLKSKKAIFWNSMLVCQMLAISFGLIAQIINDKN